jgi:hypothetical protein
MFHDFSALNSLQNEKMKMNPNASHAGTQENFLSRPLPMYVQSVTCAQFDFF